MGDIDQIMEYNTSLTIVIFKEVFFLQVVEVLTVVTSYVVIIIVLANHIFTTLLIVFVIYIINKQIFVLRLGQTLNILYLVDISQELLIMVILENFQIGIY